MEILTKGKASKLNKVRMVGRGLNKIIHISQALEEAEGQGLDLVLVSEEVVPPVVRIQDFKKIEYEKKKARKASRQVSILKEIQLKVNISEHDLATKLNHIAKFLGRGDKVKVSVRLKGREKETPERAHDLIHKIGEASECKVSKISGPIAMAILEPLKKQLKDDNRKA